MMWKKFGCVLIFLALVVYVSAILSLPFLYILSLTAFGYGVLISLAILLFKMGWALLPKKIQNTFRKHRAFSLTVVVGYALLFLIGRAVINKYYMHDVFSPIRITAKWMLLFFTLFLLWNKLAGSMRKPTLWCTIVCIIFIVLAPLMTIVNPRETSSTNRKSIASDNKSLSTIGYLGWAPAKNLDQKSIEIYDHELAYKGFTVWNPRDPITYLMNMEGEILHTWHHDEKIVRKNNITWVNSELCKNGDLLTFAIDTVFTRIDWESRPIWSTKIRAHHTFHTMQDGDIYVLARKDAVVFCRGLPYPILEDYIAVLSHEGKIRRTIPIYQAVKHHFTKERMTNIYRWLIKPKNVLEILKRKIKGKHLFDNDTVVDVMHTNSIQVLDRDVVEFGNKMDLLISVREIDLIAVLDADENKLVWSWGPGEMSRQHWPKLLNNGNVLVFDNGYDKGYSRILELDPLTKKVKWNYNSDRNRDFFSLRGGIAQRLPNGNTLITEPYGGRTFEVTKEGNTVWQYYNPNVDTKSKKRQAIFHMKKYTQQENYPILKQFQ
ncbi:MAG: hypothetical protein IID32_01050 [Planctomycetes bacterium]|nr:hypothetical protein [Planctomycetota bacterium]